MTKIQQDIDERTNLAGKNMFELMLFRLGKSEQAGRSELYGINVFKIRELVAMTDVKITAIAEAGAYTLGVVNVRGQIIQVINLPAAIGCIPESLKILMITEFGRTTQAFAVEDVDDIVRLEWSSVKSADGIASGSGTITSIAQLAEEINGSKIVQVLDVEQILRDVNGSEKQGGNTENVSRISIPSGTIILAADDSPLARALIEEGLKAMGLPYFMARDGKEAWNKLLALSQEAKAEGKTILDKVALVLTDLEMPELDGFTLTRNIKNSPDLKSVPVVIHSSLTGTANENHVKTVGANAYVAKFQAEELAATIQKTLNAN